MLKHFFSFNETILYFPDIKLFISPNLMPKLHIFFILRLAQFLIPAVFRAKF